MSKTKDHHIEVEEIRSSHSRADVLRGVTAPDAPYAAIEKVIGWIDGKLEDVAIDGRYVRLLVEAKKNLTELRRYC